MDEETILIEALKRAKANGCTLSHGLFNASLNLMEPIPKSVYTEVIFHTEFAKAFWKKDWQWYRNQMMQWDTENQKEPLRYLEWFLINDK